MQSESRKEMSFVTIETNDVKKLSPKKGEDVAYLTQNLAKSSDAHDAQHYHIFLLAVLVKVKCLLNFL